MTYIILTATLSAILLIARQFENRNPIEVNQDTSEVIADWKLAGLKWTITQLLGPVISIYSIKLITAAGGGFIVLRSDGIWFLLSFIILIIAIDFWSYIVHVAMHKIPVLWAMHSLHHSAEALSMVTGIRHYWLEQITIGSFPILAIIFKVPSEMIGPIAIVYFFLGDGFAHLNMRISFGQLTLVLNNPQYHRIHHSVEPQHWNKNFCKMLPVFDMIFGTAWKPGKDEFPKTGLVPSDKATGFLDGVIWPARHKLRARFSRTPESSTILT